MYDLLFFLKEVIATDNQMKLTLTLNKINDLFRLKNCWRVRVRVLVHTVSMSNVCMNGELSVTAGLLLPSSCCSCWNLL